MKANRNYVRRATKEGVVIKKLEKTDELFFSQIEDLATSWLENRKIKELSFLLKLDVLQDIENKYIFVALYHEKVIACLSCVPIYAKNGWYLEDMIYSKDYPIGTTQLLLFEGLTHMQKSGFTMASF
jgi:phosphatidylglycerol lysyltransferase